MCKQAAVCLHICHMNLRDTARMSFNLDRKVKNGKENALLEQLNTTTWTSLDIPIGVKLIGCLIVNLSDK